MHSNSSRRKKGSDKFAFFASLHFKITGKKLSKLLRWEEGTYLKGPLLNLRPSLVSLALEANLLIVGYMDHSADEIHNECIDGTCENDVYLIYNLVKLGCQGTLNHSEEIRDEIFCQLVKQTTKNSNRRSCLRGYQLMLSCLAGFSPTEALAPFLLSHIRLGCRGGALLSRRSVKLAEECLRALRKIQILGSRTWGISRSEISAIVSEIKFLSVKVWISPDMTLDIAVDSWSTIDEVKLLACEKLGIQCSSILTLSVTNNLNDERNTESNVASLRGLMNVFFEKSLIALLKLIDGKSKTPKTSVRVKTYAKLSERALSSIDSLFQLKELNHLNLRKENQFNSSEACLFMESVQAEKHRNHGFFSCLPWMSSLSCPRSLDLRRLLKRKRTPTADVTFKISLVVWIFPSDKMNKENVEDFPRKCSLADHSHQRGSHTDVYNNFQPIKFDRMMDLSAVFLDDECRLSQRIVQSKASTRWPCEDVVRRILFEQLSRSEITGVDNFQTLRMVGLMFATKHKDKEDLLLDSSECDLLMQKFVTEIIEEAIPSVLTTLEVSNRQDAAITIKELVMPFVFDSSQKEYEYDSGIQYGQLPNKTFVGIQDSVLLDKSECSIQSIHSFYLSPRSDFIDLMKDYSESTDWSDDKIWREFLSSVVVQFWQHYRNRLTIEECRDEFLSSAKNCFGYGVRIYNPSAVRISIQSLQHEPTPCQNQIQSILTSAKSNLGDLEDSNYSISPKPLIWASVDSYLECQINEEVSHDLKELNTIKKSLLLSVCCQEIIVTEKTIVQVKSMYGNSDLLSSTETSTEVQRIMLSDIICWGYNDQSMAIKFKQRGKGHEASYYSDDEDDDAKSPKLEGMNSYKDDSGYCSQKSIRDDEEFYDYCCSTSIASITSGCPIYPTYRYQRREDDRSTKRSARPSRDEKYITRQRSPENVPTAFDKERHNQDSAMNRERLHLSRSGSLNQDIGVRQLTGSNIMSGCDHESGYQDDCKQMDTDDNTFRTDASSDLNSITKSFMYEKRNKDEKKATQTVAIENDSDELFVSFGYGAELAELLRLYCLHSMEAEAADESH